MAACGTARRRLRRGSRRAPRRAPRTAPAAPTAGRAGRWRPRGTRSRRTWRPARQGGLGQVGRARSRRTGGRGRRGPGRRRPSTARWACTCSRQGARRACTCSRQGARRACTCSRQGARRACTGTQVRGRRGRVSWPGHPCPMVAHGVPGWATHAAVLHAGVAARLPAVSSRSHRTRAWTHTLARTRPHTNTLAPSLPIFQHRHTATLQVTRTAVGSRRPGSSAKALR